MSKEYPCVYFDHEKCTLHGTELENIDWCVMGPCGSETLSNGDHVRDMTDEELAVFLECFGGCHYCSEYKTAMFGNDGILDCDGDCERHILDWLREAYKEET